MFRMFMAVVFSLAAATGALAQLPQISDSRLGVDMVKLSSGQKLYGFILSQSLENLVIAVDRIWLEKTHHDLFEEYSKLESDSIQRNRQERGMRIQEWIDKRKSVRRLARFLEDELAALTEKDSEETTKPRFILVELQRSQVRERLVQPPEARKIGGLAFQFELETPITSPTTFLQRQLQAKGVDIAKEKVDLSKDVPHSQKESAKQWAARKALVEYVMREPLEYQGTGTTLVRKTDKMDMTTVLTQFTGGGGLDAIASLGEQLGLPEFKKLKESGDWYKKVCAEAERDDFCGVMIVRMDQSPLSPIVTVNTHFFAMESPSNWFEVRRFAAQANAQEQSGERLARLKDDPQIKSVLETLSGLGLGDQSLIDKALQHGAATQQAMDRSTSQFHEFKSRETRTLNCPPLELPAQ
jgi:hypothetical protein